LRRRKARLESAVRAQEAAQAYRFDQRHNPVSMIRDVVWGILDFFD
jgi:hypothetical protein